MDWREHMSRVFGVIDQLEKEEERRRRQIAEAEKVIEGAIAAADEELSKYGRRLHTENDNGAVILRVARGGDVELEIELKFDRKSLISKVSVLTPRGYMEGAGITLDCEDPSLLTEPDVIKFILSAYQDNLMRGRSRFD